MLFLIYINDMPEYVQAKTRLFADDSIVYRDVSTTEHCESLQADLAGLQQ